MFLAEVISNNIPSILFHSLLGFIGGLLIGVYLGYFWWYDSGDH